MQADKSLKYTFVHVLNIKINESTNTEWNVFHTCASNHTIQTNADLNWWVTSYVIHIKRNSIYHLFTLVMPCFVLSMMSIFLVSLASFNNYFYQ